MGQDVLAAVDSTTGAFAPLVQNRLRSDMQSAIDAGVRQAVSGANIYKGDKGDKGDNGSAITYSISGNTDWNTLTAPGWYIYNGYAGNVGWNGQTNAPVQADIYGILEAVTTSAGPNTIQRYTTSESVWVRHYFGSWTAWSLQSGLGKRRNGITGWFHVDDFGAKGTGAGDDTDALQAATDAAAAAYPGIGTPQRVYLAAKVYPVSARTMTQSNGNADGICSIKLHDGVELYGPGAHIRVANNAYGSGAYYGIVRSVYEGLTNAGIVGITFEGNRSSQVTSSNAGNILLEALKNVWVTDVTSVEANGNSIMVRGNAYGDYATDVRIQRCTVYGANGVGIQSSQFNGLLITDNIVRNTGDNCIDVYGEYGDHSTTPHGVNFQVNNNNCSGGLVGIFIETVAYGVAVGNRVSNCGTGFRVNRINGQPTSIGIRSNGIFGCPVGVAFSGVMESVSLTDNEVQGATTACVQFDGLQCAGVFGSDNHLNGASTSVPLVLVTSYVSAISQVYFVRTMTRSSQSPSYVNYAAATSSCTFAPASGPGF